MGNIKRMLSKTAKESEKFDAKKMRAVKNVSTYQDLVNLNEAEKEESIKRDLHISGGLPIEFTERIIGENNLVNIAFLKKGLEMSKTVCRIIQPNLANPLKPTAIGTGFLVGNGLLMTNEHVIESIHQSKRYRAEFDYEGDPEEAIINATRFKFDPDRFFVKSNILDYCIIAIESESEGDENTSIEAYGHSVLKPVEEEIYIGQSLSIIQHPSGLPKMLAIRDSRLSEIKNNLIFYSTDTEPGSSGSPVLNDGWQIIGLHRAGVPNRDENGNILLKKGGIYQGAQDDDHIHWIANKGVLIDSILEDLYEKNVPPVSQTDKEFLLKHYLPPNEEQYVSPE